MKACQNFAETKFVFPLLQSLRIMKSNDPSISDDETFLKSHGNDKLITAMVAALRVSDENGEIPLMSEEFENLKQFGESIVAEILNQRKIGDAGRYGYQQVKYRSVFITQADKDQYEAENQSMSYAQLRRNLGTQLSIMANTEVAAAIKRTVNQIEASGLSEPHRKELLYRGWLIACFLSIF